MNIRTLLAILIAASAVSLTAIGSLFATYKTAFPAEFDACALKALHLEQTDAPSPLPVFARPIVKRFWQSEHAPICKQESVFTLLFRSVEPRWNAFAQSATLGFNKVVLETAQYYLPQSSFDLFGSWIDLDSLMAPMVDSARHFAGHVLETLPLYLPTWIDVNSSMAPWIGYAVESYDRILKAVTPNTHDSMSNLEFGTFAIWAADEVVSTSASFFLVHLDAASGILRALWMGAGSMPKWSSCATWIIATITATAVILLGSIVISCPGLRRELKVRIQEVTDEIGPTSAKLRNWAFSLHRELKVRIQEVTDEIGPTNVKLRDWAFSLRRELKVRIQEVTDEIGPTSAKLRNWAFSLHCEFKVRIQETTDEAGPEIAWFCNMTVVQLLERAVQGLARLIVLVAKRAAVLAGALVKLLLSIVIGMVCDALKRCIHLVLTICIGVTSACYFETQFGTWALLKYSAVIICLSHFASRSLFYILEKTYKAARNTRG